MSWKRPYVLLKVSFEKMCFSAVLKILIVALALILFGHVFQAFAADTVNNLALHEFLAFCSVLYNVFALYSSLDLGLVRSSAIYTFGCLPQRDFLTLVKVVFDL